jgi:nicotinate-nucleotide adenylyltransferase
LKQSEPSASVDHRLEMVRLATLDIPNYQVCDIEAHRPGPTYSVDTLVELSDKLGSIADLFFILGLDVLGQLDRWKEPERVLELCQLLVLNRPGEQDFDWTGFYGRIPKAKDRVQVVTAPLVDVSATDLRSRATAGEPLEGQVPDAVAEYIRQQGLYLTAGEGRTAN